MPYNIRPHRTHETIAMDDPVAWCVCQSLYHVPAHSNNGCTDRGPVLGWRLLGAQGTYYMLLDIGAHRRGEEGWI